MSRSLIPYLSELYRLLNVYPMNLINLFYHPSILILYKCIVVIKILPMFVSIVTIPLV